MSSSIAALRLLSKMPHNVLCHGTKEVRWQLALGTAVVIMIINKPSGRGRSGGRGGGGGKVVARQKGNNGERMSPSCGAFWTLAL